MPSDEEVNYLIRGDRLERESPSPEEVAEAREHNGEMDLTLKLLESRQAKLKVDGNGVRLVVRDDISGPLLGEVVKHRLNESIAARGFGPRQPRVDPYEALGVRYAPRPGNPGMPPRPAGPGPAGAPVPRPGNPGTPPRPASLPEPAAEISEPSVVLAEEAHRVADCPECAQGKHANCDGSAWCRTHDAREICPCAQNDHQ